MKKILVPLFILFSGAFNCFPQISDSGYVDPSQGCQAYFDYYLNDSIETFVEAYPYRFNDLSEGDVIQWKWDFGDGQTSNDKNPIHLYPHAGDTMNVCLSIITSDNCNSQFCMRIITGDKPWPQCTNDFYILEGESYPPVYRFIPDSVKGRGYYYWDFGDGSYSYEDSPSHTYEFSGTYNVCLQTSFEDGCSAYTCKILAATGFNKECKAFWNVFPNMGMDPGRSFRADTSNSPIAGNYYFQDLSKGNVLTWSWDFGDGTRSSEQNPVHTYDRDGIYNVCLGILTADSCMSTYCDTLYAGVTPYCRITGTVIDYTGLDGCGLLIQLDNGEILEPVEIVPNFILRNGQRVHLAYTELKDRASICMAGKIVRIDCIGEISTDVCMAAFTHYPLPWVSSYPPIYQFNDISGGDVSERKWDLGDGTVTREDAPTHRYKYSGSYTVCLTIYTKNGCTSTSCETSYFEGADPNPGLCSNYIRLNTDIILNGQICNGTATAGLVDKNGNPVPAIDYYWSTGESGPVIHNLCPGINYSVIVTDSSGCAVSGSFAFGGNATIPDSLFGFWNFQQDDRNFIFNIPVFSDSIYCEWDFGDGEKAGGISVNHTYESDEEQLVTLRVFDLNGNLLYDQQIPVMPGTPTRLRKLTEAALEVYPVPAKDVLFMNIISEFGGAKSVEILTSTGQLIRIPTMLNQDNNILRLDVSGLPAGFYIGKLVYENGRQQPFRFVK